MICSWSSGASARLRAGPRADARVGDAAGNPRRTVTWGGGFIVATLDPGAPCDERVDLDTLVPPLLVRGPADGDRFEPLGMDGRSTPLNDFFRGRGVWRDRRGDVPLVCDQRGIIWVVGHRIAHRVRRTEATSRTLGLRFDIRRVPKLLRLTVAAALAYHPAPFSMVSLAH